MTAVMRRHAMWRMTAGAALISTTSIFVRWSHVAPTVSALYRMLFGGLMLAVLLAVRGQWHRLSPADVKWLLLPAMAFAADLMVWHRSIWYIGPGLATLIGNFQVFIMAFVGVVVYRERLGWRFVFGLALALFGLWLLVGVEWAGLTSRFRIGVGLGLLTGVAYAVYLLSFRQARLHRPQLDPTQLLCVMSLLCAALLAVAVPVEGDSFAIPDAHTWSALLGLGLFGQVLGWVLIVRAMPLLPASLVGLLLLLQPGISFVLDVVIFARPTSRLDWLGLALALLGIFIGSLRGRSANGGQTA